MAIKLIALDIDGTLSKADNVVSKANRDAIQSAQAAGVFVTLATGRNYLASKPILDQLHVDGPSIHYGGAWIVDAKSGSTIYEDALSSDTVNAVLNIAAEFGIHAQIYQGNTVLYEKENAFASQYCAKHRLPFVIDPLIREKEFMHVPKILAYVDPEKEDAVRALLAERIGEIAGVSRSEPGFIEINSRHASKGRALAHIAKVMGVLQSETAALGDSYLDLDMIQWAGHGVCMADGVEPVKSKADMIVPSCAEDGVAYYIERYVLKK